MGRRQLLQRICNVFVQRKHLKKKGRNKISGVDSPQTVTTTKATALDTSFKICAHLLAHTTFWSEHICTQLCKKVYQNIYALLINIFIITYLYTKEELLGKCVPLWNCFNEILLFSSQTWVRTCCQRYCNLGSKEKENCNIE